MRAVLTLLFVLAAPVLARAEDITLASVGLPDATLSTDRLLSLPATDVPVTLGSPPAEHVFQGPLLWTVLTDTALVDPAKHMSVGRQTLRIQGSDGYVAILAVGELSPEFEGKRVILAVRMDGKALAHPRVIVPGDHRLGRSVRDVARLTLDELPKP